MKEFIKKTYKPFIKSVAFITIFILLFLHVQEVFKLKGSGYGKYTYFSEEEDNSMDIMFFGNSRMNRGVDPLIIDDINQTLSYNMGIQGLRSNHVYIRMKNAFMTQTPKLTVIETGILTPASSDKLEEQYSQRTLLSLPTSLFKLESAVELASDAKGVSTANRALELFLPLIRFHARYEEIDSVDYLYCMDLNDDFEYENRYSEEVMMSHRGYTAYPTQKQLKDSYSKYKKKKYAEVTDVATLDAQTEEYLDKMVELCRSIGSEILFLSIPAFDKDANYKVTIPITNYLSEKYKNDEDIHILDTNLHYNDVGYDYFYFQNTSHLNEDGAKLLSNYLGAYIKENYSDILH